MHNFKAISIIATATAAIGICSTTLQTSFNSNYSTIDDNSKRRKPLSPLFVQALSVTRTPAFTLTGTGTGTGTLKIRTARTEKTAFICNNRQHRINYHFKRRYSEREFQNDHLHPSSASSSASSSAPSSASPSSLHSSSDDVNYAFTSPLGHFDAQSAGLNQSPVDQQMQQQQQQQLILNNNGSYASSSSAAPLSSMNQSPPGNAPQQQSQQLHHQPPHSNNSIQSDYPHLDIQSQPQPQKIDTFTLPDYAAPTLDGRLLCASQCAYSITQPYFRSSAFRPATTAKRLTKGVNSLIIGHTIDGICIAFRGTQTTSPIDWLQNAALFLSNEKSIKGKVHTGFYRGTKSLWKPLKNIIKEMIEESRMNGWKDEVFLTGHSKGGALATVAAVLMKRDNDIPDPTYVCTFASAKVGDSEFCTEYNKNINQTSYEAHLDLIPFLPPSSSNMEMMNDEMTDMLDTMLWSDTSIHKKQNYKWDYQTVGKRKFINEKYEIIDDVTKELDEQRIKEIEKFSFLSIDEFKAAHCSSCPGDDCTGYYFNAVARGVCEEEECTPPNELNVGNDSGSNFQSVQVNSEVQEM